MINWKCTFGFHKYRSTSGEMSPAETPIFPFAVSPVGIPSKYNFLTLSIDLIEGTMKESFDIKFCINCEKTLLVRVLDKDIK